MLSVRSTPNLGFEIRPISRSSLSRDNVRTWLVGRVKETVALNKLKPMFANAKVDVAARLPNQETGEFHLIRDGNVTSLRAAPAIMATEQLPEHEILELARQTRDVGSSG